jgi:mono/diheme cytochrome c family protein
MKRLSAFFTCLLLLSIAASATEAKLDFTKDVQPILAAKCYECHGPDKGKGGLRLTKRESALGKSESGKTAVVPGHPEQSELIARLITTDPDEKMPSKGEPLTPAQVETLRRWIAAGAEWKEHWAYRPIDAVKVPKIQNEAWAKNPIDQFVGAILEAKKVSPSPEADRYTLIKRLSYDLVGMPPTPEEVEAFVADKSPEAYDKLVGRLLSSKHFGERWGRHWLDKARYADSDGYEKDNARPDAWRYRDWVIDAVNADMPFDKFTIEQLAGDLLPNATQSH